MELGWGFFRGDSKLRRRILEEVCREISSLILRYDVRIACEDRDPKFDYDIACVLCSLISHKFGSRVFGSSIDDVKHWISIDKHYVHFYFVVESYIVNG